MKERDVEHKGYQAFVDTLTRVPDLKVNAVPQSAELSVGVGAADFIADVWYKDKLSQFIIEVKSNGQPRNAAAAIAQLKTFISGIDQPAHPVFIAPYISKETRAMCEEAGVNYLDLAGNARIAFDGIYIEREAVGNPFKEKREFRAIFSPKSAQVLKILLRTPERPWRMADLADAANVSIGQVSNVKSALIEQDWATVAQGGFALRDPGGLLEAWRDVYDGVSGSVLHYYTTLHGARLDEAVRSLMELLDEPHAMLASFTAANWYAPYARVGSEIFYADQEGLELLTQALQLSPAAKGGNVTITCLYDKMPLMDAQSIGVDRWCTSPVQTYLDLWISGERGREAAEFLRREAFSW
ncbi:hypothetical protein [Asticcacaulis sp. YBE204]|uniref:hypothetical protein n=1 Tax=Asticcacaulis sp. YBE204 TaxID=1282363 RepID=UPI001F3F567F|nr:hypothetical protein [Asticcacaulis sp. YBE204]